MAKRSGSRKVRQQRAKQAQSRLCAIISSPQAHSQRLLHSAANQLWTVSTRHNLRLPPQHRHWLCRGCKALLRPGISARVRIRGKMRCITCKSCGSIRRFNLR